MTQANFAILAEHPLYIKLKFSEKSDYTICALERMHGRIDVKEDR